jgi:hypothetical protein
MRPLFMLGASFGMTLFVWALWRGFLRDLKRGVIRGRHPDIYRDRTPRYFAFVKALNFALFPVLVLVIAMFWYLAIRELV